MIADADHLARIAAGIVQHAAVLAAAWREEEAAACAPSMHLDAVRRGSGPGDPVHAAATNPHRWRDRDQVGAVLEHAHRQLERAARAAGLT